MEYVLVTKYAKRIVYHHESFPDPEAVFMQTAERVPMRPGGGGIRSPFDTL